MLPGNSGQGSISYPSVVTQVASALGWNPAFTYAQMDLETAGFTSTEWRQDNNPTGIKYYSGMKDATKGNPASDGGYYAHFKNAAQGMIDFVRNNPRYANVASTQDPYQEAKLIASDGWATDPNYANKLDSILQSMGFQSNGAYTGLGTVGSNSQFGLTDAPVNVTSPMAFYQAVNQQETVKPASATSISPVTNLANQAQHVGFRVMIFLVGLIVLIFGIYMIAKPIVSSRFGK